ncbi:MAG TPA: MmcQ/YjbR family DNA-binding protein [Pseudonocardiaceae bacterium]|jgi:predicted DNA-binding protein (MmcQ/YjbR family)|nr:MmcQ/YjbR family DNA-binding protein [Pseudonocardiaceae bacterium]
MGGPSVDALVSSLVSSLVSYCLAKPGAEETYPFGEGEMTCKVGGKAFAFIGLSGTLGVKCGPTAEAAAEWRQRYPSAVTVSAYIGRYGWNTVALDGTVPAAELRELVDASYEDVVSRLPKSKRP